MDGCIGKLKSQLVDLWINLNHPLRVGSNVWSFIIRTWSRGVWEYTCSDYRQRVFWLPTCKRVLLTFILSCSPLFSCVKMNPIAELVFFIVLVNFFRPGLPVSLWQSMQVTCELESIKRKVSHPKCADRIIDAKGCRGTCQSFTKILMMAPWHETICDCCREDGFNMRSETLKCTGGSTVTVSIKEPTACKCQECKST